MSADRVMGYLCYGNALLATVLGGVIAHGMWVAPGHIISSQEFVHTTNVVLEDTCILGWFVLMGVCMIGAGMTLHARVRREAKLYGA